ncbi:hypothetical protein Apa02nite_000910 [Actinoplanes palleronii]|uniref:Uncharacterized protein n=1 Tax=Actinoplanes palleronii TaxID=113570 RepID=A0ABQ4AZX4_9ACTN|nr:hypothetical protein Apa02nite_000910 [Actinoplanes palleronii]
MRHVIQRRVIRVIQRRVIRVVCRRVIRVVGRRVSVAAPSVAARRLLPAPGRGASRGFWLVLRGAYRAGRHP